MNIEDIEVGITITIADCIDITKRRHTICRSMLAMRNKRFKVGEIDKEYNQVKVNGWTWAPEDIRAPVVEPFNTGPTIFHFDPKHL